MDLKRALRLMWVLFTNLTAVYVLYSGVRQRVLLNSLLDSPRTTNKALWIQFAMWAAIPFLGIVLEACRSRFAKWLNLGYLICIGIMFSAMGILNLPDYHAFIPLLFGIVALVFLGVSYLLYRNPNPSPIAPKAKSR